MPSVKFDSTEILNTTYNPRFSKHESAPDRDLGLQQFAREDGSVLVYDRYGEKRIKLQGVLVGSTQADLESKIDAFKELFSRVAKNLDISWNSGTRRYVATVERHEFDRDYFHLNYVPWTAEFVVPSGEGKDTSDTTALNSTLTTTTPATSSFSMLGSKPAKPLIKLTGANWGSGVLGVEFLNTDTREKIVLTRPSAFGSTDIVRFYAALKKATYEVSAIETEMQFYGLFPKFKIGTNAFKITAGGLVNQSSNDTDAANDSGSGMVVSGTSQKVAQSFSVPYSDASFKGIIIVLEKTGSPGNVTWRIETDDGNKPSGSLAHANATGTILAASVTGTRSYITSYASAVYPLSANTKYWLVFSIASADGSNTMTWYKMNQTLGKYTRGDAIRTFDGSWTDNNQVDETLMFRILYGGEPAAQSTTVNITYPQTFL